MKWNTLEHSAYLTFVKNNQDKLVQAKKWNVFSLMSKAMKTRDCRQCKSHHTKMLRKHANSL